VTVAAAGTSGFYDVVSTPARVSAGTVIDVTFSVFGLLPAPFVGFIVNASAYAAGPAAGNWTAHRYGRTFISDVSGAVPAAAVPTPGAYFAVLRAADGVWSPGAALDVINAGAPTATPSPTRSPSTSPAGTTTPSPSVTLTPSPSPPTPPSPRANLPGAESGAGGAAPPASALSAAAFAAFATGALAAAAVGTVALVRQCPRQFLFKSSSSTERAAEPGATLNPLR
jgi:hypothetical protein